MGAVGRKLRSCEGGQISFWCPGCKEAHAIRIGTWTWNGDGDSPTFSPSILVTCGHYAPGFQPGEHWCTYNAEHPSDPSGFACHRCHSFVTNGQIQFLADSTHSLAGQTVPLPDWEGTH